MKPKNINQIPAIIPLTEKIMAADLINRQDNGSRLSCHKISIPANEAYPIHEHPSEHIIYVVEGDGWMKLWKGRKEQSYELTSGDVFFVPADLPHQVGANSKGAVMIAVSVDSLPLTDPRRLRVVKK